MLTVHRATGTSKPQELPLTASLFIFCSSTTNLLSFLLLLAWNSSCLKPLLSETAYTRLPEHLCCFQTSLEEKFKKKKDTNLEAGIKLYSSAEIRGVRQIRIFKMSGTNVLLFFLHAVSLSLCGLLSFSSTKLCLTLGKAIGVGIRSNFVCTGVCG